MRPHLDPQASRRSFVPDHAESGAPAGRARFERAIRGEPEDGGRTVDIEVLRKLAQARVARTLEVPYGSNAVFLLEFDAPDPEVPDQRMRAVYKPTRGERPLWDFPTHTLYFREVAAYLVDAALDLGFVPPTVARDGPFGPGSVQLYVHSLDRELKADEVASIEAQLRDVAALDVLLNNADRKRSHLMVTRKLGLRAIDNALTFLPYPRQRTALIAFGGSAVSATFTERLRSLAADTAQTDALGKRLGRLLTRQEVDALLQRVAEFAEDPTFPVLDDWDGRPFEWW